MDIIHHKHEVTRVAPTGAAADVIGGNTYHTSLRTSLKTSAGCGSVASGAYVVFSFNR